MHIIEIWRVPYNGFLLLAEETRPIITDKLKPLNRQYKNSKLIGIISPLVWNEFMCVLISP